MKKDEYFQYVSDCYKPAEKMLKMVPADKLGWKPGPNFLSMGQLVCHLAGGIGAELDMMLKNAWPEMGDIAEGLKNMPSCSVQEALEKLEKDRSVLREVLAGMTEDDFANKIVSVPWGWKSKMELMALNFRDHFVNHKMQLFTYLKLLGLPVNTETLYFG